MNTECKTPGDIVDCRCAVHFVVYLSNTPTNAHNNLKFNNLKCTLKDLKRSYMFRSYDHLQGAYFVRAKVTVYNTQ